MFMFVTTSFSNTLSSDGYYIDKTTIQLLIMIPILIFMVIRIIKSAVKLDKLIIEVFKPSLIPNKKIDYLFVVIYNFFVKYHPLIQGSCILWQNQLVAYVERHLAFFPIKPV